MWRDHSGWGALILGGLGISLLEAHLRSVDSEGRAARGTSIFSAAQQLSSRAFCVSSMAVRELRGSRSFPHSLQSWRPHMTSRARRRDVAGCQADCWSLLPGLGARRLSIAALQARVQLPGSENEKDGLRCRRPLALFSSFTPCKRQKVLKASLYFLEKMDLHAKRMSVGSRIPFSPSLACRQKPASPRGLKKKAPTC